MISSFEKNAFCRNILANLINLKRIHSFSQSQRLWSTRRICLCWSHVTYWLCLMCSVEAGDDWQWVKCNEVLGFKSWLLKWFFTSIGTDVQQILRDALTFVLPCFSCLGHSCSVSPVFLLFFFSFLSIRRTQASRCRHIVFISRPLRAGPRLPAIGLLDGGWAGSICDASQSLSHQEIRSVTA